MDGSFVARRRRCQSLVTGTGAVHLWQGEVIGPPLRFEAGQYVNVLHPHGDAIPFSIASPPGQLPLLDIHYAPTPGHPHTVLMDALIHAEHLVLSAAGGTCTIASADVPLLLVATGTGIGQALSIAGDQHARGHACGLHVIRHALQEDDLYLRDRIRARLLAGGATIDECIGDLTALLDRLAEQPLAPGTHVVLTGDPDWVWSARDRLVARAEPPARILSDVFSYAPRSTVPARPASRD